MFAMKVLRASIIKRSLRTTLQVQPRFLGTKVTASMVKELRTVTGAPMMECKTALANEEVDGDMERAVAWLRKNGVQTAQKKSGRETSAGQVGVRVCTEQGVAAIVEINSETDFVAKNDQFLDMVDVILGATVGNSDVFVETNDTGGCYDLDVETVLDLPVSGDSKNIRGVITNAVATMRENISLKRVARLRFDPSNEMVSAYVHNDRP